MWPPAWHYRGNQAAGPPHLRLFYCLGRQVDAHSCPQSLAPIGDIEDAVRAYWANVRIPAERIPALRQAILADFAGKHEQGKTELDVQKRRIIEYEQRRKKAKAAYYANVIDLDDFKAEQERIRHGVQAAEGIIAQWSVELESIKAALDTACALVENPQVLYDELPVGLKVMLMQAVFEKLWVLDTSIVGSDLSETFAELLSLDARLALAEQQQQAQDGPNSTDQEVTYYRTRETLSMLLRDWGASWERPYVERPRGPLPIDKQNPGRREAQGLNMQHLVRVTGYKLNPQLLRWVREHPTVSGRCSSDDTFTSYRRRHWRLRERLTEVDLIRLIMAFETGMATRAIAEHFRMNVKSVRKLLYEQDTRG